MEVIEEYISGAKTKRSGTEKLINLAKANKIQKVLIHEVSRLGRNVSDLYNTVEELCNNKVSVFDLNQRQETLTKDYQKTTYASLILPLLAGMAEEWLKQHSYRIKSGLEQAKKKGIKLGRPKQEKLKKEDEIIAIRKLGYVEDEFGRRKKAGYGTIAKYVGVSVATVRTIIKKHDLGGRI